MRSIKMPVWPAAVFLFALAACDGEGFHRVPEVSAQPNASAQDAKPSAPEAASGVPQQPAEPPEDAELAARVEAALKAEPSLHGASIAVRSDDGVVTLRGSTKDPELRSMAAHVALSVEGVKHVRNEIALARDA